MPDFDGTAGDDTFVGTDANERIYGWLGNDQLSGAGGNDNLYGEEGADILDGGAGNDTLFSDWIFGDQGTEVDMLIGGAGDDALYVGYGDNADGGAGSDRLRYDLRASPTAVTLDFSGLNAGGTVTIAGGLLQGFEWVNAIQGTGFADTITYGGNSDGYFSSIDGLGGNDTLTGGTGSQTISGGDGDDTIYGMAGADDLFGGNGDDALFGGDDNDSLRGDAGNDTLNGGDGVNSLYGDVGNDILTGGSGFDNLSGAAGNDTLNGGGGGDYMSGDEGDDKLYGGAGDDGAEILGMTGLLGGIGADILDGGDGNDRLNSGGAYLSAFDFGIEIDTLTGGNGDDGLHAGFGDKVDGGAGNDILSYSFRGSPQGVTVDFGVLTSGGTLTFGGGLLEGIEYVSELDGSEFADTITVVGAPGPGWINGFERAVYGNGGDDVLVGTSVIFGYSFFLHGGDGNDTLSGGFYFDGGAGSDTVNYADAPYGVTVSLAIQGAYQNTSGVGLNYLTAIENLVGSGFDDALTGAAGDNVLRGGAGNDTLDGGGGNDLLSPGAGMDSALGGDGNDGFYFGAELDAADSADGGAGSGDQLALQGNYAGLTLAAAHLVNIEALIFLPGNDMRFGDTAGNTYSYNLGTVDANVGAGQLLTINFNTLRAGENVVFNGSAESNGSFLTYGGLGSDLLTGGQQSDGFYFGIGRFGSPDTVDGQGGSDQFGLQGLYAGASAVVFGASQLVGVETLALLSGGDTRFGSGGLPYSYDLTMNDGNVGAGQNMTVNANSLLSDETLTFNGSAESNGKFTIFSGAGADTLTGSAGADTIYGGAGADVMSGGAGNDTFAFLSTAHSTSSVRDTILDLRLGDQINLLAIDANTGTGANDAFSFVGSAAFSNTPGELRAFTADGANWLVQGDTDGNGVADLEIYVVASDLDPITAGDFVL